MKCVQVSVDCVAYWLENVVCLSKKFAYHYYILYRECYPLNCNMYFICTWYTLMRFYKEFLAGRNIFDYGQPRDDCCI